MPTVVLVDVSLSMRRQASTLESGDQDMQLRQLAVAGINSLLDHLVQHCRLEFVTLVAYSSLYEVVVPFTRDVESIRSKLPNIEEYDRTCLGTALSGVNQLVMEEWGSGVPCQVILVSDGGVGIGPNSLPRLLQTWESAPAATNGADTPATAPIPFGFPGRLNVMMLMSPTDPAFHSNQSSFQRLVDMAGGDGAVYCPQASLSTKSVQNMFLDMARRCYDSFRGTLHCGNLESSISLCPPPRMYAANQDFEVVRKKVSKDLHVCGFLEMADLASPAALSRHLVLPVGGGPSGGKDSSKANGDEDDDVSVDEGRLASLCVLLHGALKIESMAALCQVGEDWYGILYSWADNRKKSNLMLSVFEPGTLPVSWLGDLRKIGPLLEGVGENGEELSFPVKSNEKRSYSQNSVVWIRQAGIHSDIQKILRHARKLPDKTQHFYKELNRIRRAAVSLGFHELLDGLAAIFERECTLLPGSAHPDCALQLTHAAGMLRQPQSRDIKFTITPLHTKFRSDD